MEQGTGPQRSDRPTSTRVAGKIDVCRLERQKRALYDLLKTLQIPEPDDKRAAPLNALQELWGLIDVCEDLLDAAENEGIGWDETIQD